ncbi:methyltransferase [Alteromonas sp. C1M14]|uniref:methyltransferase n=1 Tax=Alteromonas sp. C1M14 TaxID=2841567 RepID=UPI001C083CD0|nr:methyltransferase [Alteromonas sp. C1M14]MBU2977573.1 methyltransferase [Alteromonas sp. C1M14]
MSDNTRFVCHGKPFTLIRHPAKHQHVSLQAWDSADELIIDHIHTVLDGSLGKSIIFNDDFGALGCYFASQHPCWVSDSWIAHRSLADNLTGNDIPCELSEKAQVRAPINAIDCLDPLPSSPDTVIIKIPRTLALLEHQLIALQKVITADTRVIAGAKVKTITRSVLALFERYLGTTTTSLAKKKSRLIFATVDPAIKSKDQHSPYPTSWTTAAQNGQTLTITNHANVFSRQSLDVGARFLLTHMTVTNNERIIDLGCGNGVLGLNALALAPQAKVTFVDESFMALASARDNVATNFPDALDQCEFVPSNCLDGLKQQGQDNFSKVFCNPPFHQQNAITDHIAWQMFTDARHVLARGGQLVVVGNRHLDYHVKLKRIFGGVTQLASHQKFVILCCAKR